MSSHSPEIPSGEILGPVPHRIDPDKFDVLLYPPEVPIVQRHRYKTTVIKSRSNQEYRATISGNVPHEFLEYRAIVDSQEGLIDRRLRFFLDLSVPVIVPLYHEIVDISIEHSIGVTTIQGDFQYSDIAAGNTVVITNRSRTKAQVTDIISWSSSEITIEDSTLFVLDSHSAIYSTRMIRQDPNSFLGHFPVGAGIHLLRGQVVEPTTILARGGSVFRYQGFPVLLDRPIVVRNSEQENFYERIDRIDFGGKFQVNVYTDVSSIRRLLTYKIDSAQVRQNFKAFFKAVAGRQRPFLLPSFRPIVTINQFTGGSTQISIYSSKIDPNLWWQHVGHKYIAIRGMNNSGQHSILIREITEIQDLGNGIYQFTLDVPVPNSIIEIDEIWGVEQCRLSDDGVIWRHYHTYSHVTFAVETIDHGV